VSVGCSEGGGKKEGESGQGGIKTNDIRRKLKKIKEAGGGCEGGKSVSFKQKKKRGTKERGLKWGKATCGALNHCKKRERLKKQGRGQKKRGNK